MQSQSIAVVLGGGWEVFCLPSASGILLSTVALRPISFCGF